MMFMKINPVDLQEYCNLREAEETIMSHEIDLIEENDCDV